MKRTVGLLALVTMMVFVLSACGGNNNKTDASPSASVASEETASESPSASNVSATEVAEPELKPEDGAKLKIWVDKTERTFIDSVLPDFKTKFGVDVTIEEVNIPNQAEKLETDGPAKLAADVLMLPHDKLSKLVVANLLLPNDLFEEETKASSLETAITASSYDGILYGYPETIETFGLFYNKALVKEVPKTWDEVIAFAKTFNDPANKKYTIAWLHNLYFNSMFIRPYGGYIFGKDGTDGSDIGLNNDGAVEGMKYYQSLFDIAPIKTTDLTYDIQSELFTSGKLAMTIDGPWSIGAYKGKVDFGIAPLPDLPGGKKSLSLAGVRSFYVNSYTEYPIAAKMLANFLVSKESALKDFELANIIPANKEANEDPRIKNDPILSGIVEQFKNSTPTPSIPEMNNVWGPTDAAFASIWNGKEDVKATLDKTVQSIKDLNSSVAK
ncbi:sugar ABC transporter substrate-binding protein [Cohnella herbarum]|uniref:Maltodextrin-binding protein n=1 Tax=Cohnella herbarum TaxID=2728023 RepID=A0A7Z2ZL37_9BACL|nr:maltose ABC transporter substrate-binding protein [Cohnella herbarum]QJD83811.1 maltose ABC transporter substrate-binding protein [Cohnella herbarum]